jgi:hypothetical protein
MERVRYSHLGLDCCPKCHGVWLDGDEIAEVLGPAFSDATPPKIRKKIVYGQSGVIVAAFISAFYRTIGLWPLLIVLGAGSLCHFVIEKYGNDRSRRFSYAISILVGLLALEAGGPFFLNERFMGWSGFVAVVLIPLALLLGLVSTVGKGVPIALIAYEMLLFALSLWLMFSASSRVQSNAGLFHTVLNGAILLALLHAYAGIRRRVGDGLLIAGFAMAGLGAAKGSLALAASAGLLILVSHLFHPLGEQLKRVGLWPPGRLPHGQNTRHSTGEDKDAV